LSKHLNYKEILLLNTRLLSMLQNKLILLFNKKLLTQSKQKILALLSNRKLLTQNKQKILNNLILVLQLVEVLTSNAKISQL